MRRRDFIRGLGLLGISAAVADRLAFVQGLGRVFPSAALPFRISDDFSRADSGLGPEWYHVAGQPYMLRQAPGGLQLTRGHEALGFYPAANVGKGDTIEMRLAGDEVTVWIGGEKQSHHRFT